MGTLTLNEDSLLNISRRAGSFPSATMVISYRDIIKLSRTHIALPDLTGLPEAMLPALTSWLIYKAQKGQSCVRMEAEQYARRLRDMSADNPEIAMRIVNYNIMNNYDRIFNPGQIRHISAAAAAQAKRSEVAALADEAEAILRNSASAEVP